MKYLLTLALFFLFSPEAFAQPRTSFRMDDEAISKYAGERSHQMQYRIGRLAGEKLPVYTSKNLAKSYTKDELLLIGARCESITIPSYDPDDPFDIIDTTICTLFDPYENHIWILYPDKSFKSNEWKEVKSVRVSFAYSPEKDSFLYCYSRPDLDSRLLPEEKRLLQAYMSYTNPSGHRMDSMIISDTLLKTFIATWYDSISATVYRRVEKEAVKIFHNDSLAGRLSLEELEEIGGECYTAQIPNPSNPDDPYDLVDATICEVFMPSELRGFAAVYDWTIGATDSRNSLRGIGLLFKQRIAEIELQERPMFWLSAADFKKVIPAEDWMLMTDIFNFHLLSSIEENYHTR